jgi:hypothetical protein
MQANPLVPDAGMFEGVLAAYKLLSTNDKIVSYVMINDMWGPTKLSSKDN